MWLSKRAVFFTVVCQRFRDGRLICFPHTHGHCTVVSQVSSSYYPVVYIVSAAALFVFRVRLRARVGGFGGACRASPTPVVAGPVGAAAFRRPSRAVRLRAASRPPAAGARPPPGPLPVLDSCAAPGTSPDAMPHGELPSCALTSGTHASVFRPARSPRHDPDRTLSCVRFDAFVILVRCSGVHDRHCTQQIRFFFSQSHTRGLPHYSRAFHPASVTGRSRCHDHERLS